MSSLDSEAAFTDRAEKIGIEKWIVDKFRAKKFATFGKLAFAFSYPPQSTDDGPLRTFINNLVEDEPGADQMAALRRLFFEARTMALTDVRHRAESNPDPSQAVRKLATAERVARQKAQQVRLGGLVFNPNTIPPNHLVDLYVEMVESGILSYIKAEHCCSRAQEPHCVDRRNWDAQGHGSLSRAATQAGFSVLSVDHDSSNAMVPMVVLDLTSPSGVAILWDILESDNLMGVHMGLPCGTASLARERPASKELQAMGVPNPPPLRSAMHPLGLPNLGEFHRAKVESANKLYRLAIEILVFCHRRGIIVSIENRANSWLWAALVRNTLETFAEAATALNFLEKVEFHACCHGSTRRKCTGWLGTPNVFYSLSSNLHLRSPA
eukprot:s804_g3.t1